MRPVAGALALAALLLPLASAGQESMTSHRVSGVVLRPDGQPASGAKVVVVANDSMSEPVYTDEHGAFSLDSWPIGDTLVHASDHGRSARVSSSARPEAGLSLTLVEPGTIQGEVRLPKRAHADDLQGYIGPAGVSALLPGVWWGPKPKFKGNRFTIENVPAGDVQVFVGSEKLKLAGQSKVRVEPGRVSTVSIDVQRAESRVHGLVLSATTHKAIPRYQAFLLLPDGSPEAWYLPGPEFSFVARTAGDRVLLFTAPGYKSKRVSVHLEDGQSSDIGQVLLETTPPR